MTPEYSQLNHVNISKHTVSTNLKGVKCENRKENHTVGNKGCSRIIVSTCVA